MPNWCANLLIATSQDDRDRLRACCPDGQFDFNTIDPMPAALADFGPAMIEDDIDLYRRVLEDDDYRDAYAELRRRAAAGKKLSPPSQIKPLRAVAGDRRGPYVGALESDHAERVAHARRHLAVRAETGFNSWYDWAMQHWGVKWNAADTKIAESDEALRVRFDTPWAPPVAVLEKLARKEPALSADFACVVEIEDGFGEGRIEGGQFKIDWLGSAGECGEAVSLRLRKLVHGENASPYPASP
jgi:hypothetical protein